MVPRRLRDHASHEEGLYRGCGVDTNFKNTEFLGAVFVLTFSISCNNSRLEVSYTCKTYRGRHAIVLENTVIVKLLFFDDKFLNVSFAIF